MKGRQSNASVCVALGALFTAKQRHERDDHRRRIQRLSLVIGGSFAALVGMALAVHFLFMPLDVLWFTLMRRLDRALPMLSECSQSGYWVGFIWNA